MGRANDPGQTSLWDRAQLPPGPESMAARFWKFHIENPHIYHRLVDMALQLKRQGVYNYGMGSLFEVLRWHYATSPDPKEEFKLNNNYRAFYARLIMRNVEALDGFFTTRDSQADEETQS